MWLMKIWVVQMLRGPVWLLCNASPFILDMTDASPLIKAAKLKYKSEACLWNMVEDDGSSSPCDVMEPYLTTNNIYARA
jgi:hypothetical protein